MQPIKAGSTLRVLKLTKNTMTNKKSVLMTLFHRYGYFDGCTGIAANVLQLAEVRDYEELIFNLNIKI